MEEYAEVAPPGRLAGDVRCVWWSSFGTGHPILPDGCIDLIVTPGLPSGPGGSGVFVAGPDTHAVSSGLPPGQPVHGIRFRPGRAPRVLGVPADELRDQRVDLADLWGAEGERIAARLHDDPGTLPAVVAARLDRTRQTTDPYVCEVARRLWTGTSRVSAVLADLPVSERHFRRSFTAAVGYGPATFLRVARLQHARHLALTRPGTGLADLAVDAGYADQAHLSRDVRALTGQRARNVLFREVASAGSDPGAADRRLP